MLLEPIRCEGQNEKKLSLSISVWQYLICMKIRVCIVYSVHGPRPTPVPTPVGPFIDMIDSLESLSGLDTNFMYSLLFGPCHKKTYLQGLQLSKCSTTETS